MTDLRTSLSDTAQRELDTLRAALDVRLMALEKALAHPDPSESLEALIIDLARVATDEAHASAARKWLDAQAAADDHAAQAAPAAGGAAGIHGALIEEAAGLRRELDELRARLARETDRADGLRRDADAAQAALQEERAAAARLGSELTQLRNTKTDLAEAVETLRGELDAARRSVVEATSEAYRAAARDVESGRAAAAAVEARYADLERSLNTEREELREQLRTAESRTAEAAGRADAAEAALAAETTRLRAAESTLESESGRLRDVEAALAAEAERVRAANAALGAEVAKVEVAEAALASEAGKAGAAHAELSSLADQIGAAKAEASSLAQQLEAAKAELEKAQSSYEDLFAEYEMAEAAHKTAVADLESARGVFDAARTEAVAALAAETERARTATESASSARAQAAARDRTPPDDDVQKRLEAATSRVHELELQLFRRGQASAESSDLDLGGMLEERAPTGDRPIRRFSRYSFRSKMDVDIEGEPAQLVDLSVGGAQVLSETPLELNREAAVALVSDEIPVSGRAKVMWTRADPQSKGRALRYRAGIQFTDVDPAAVEAYIIRYSST